MKKAITIMIEKPWATWVRLTNALRPVVRTGHMIACQKCHTLIDVGDICFAVSEKPDADQAWCRCCAIGRLLALRLVDVETAFQIPAIGPIPEWMESIWPMYWQAPPRERPGCGDFNCCNACDLTSPKIFE